VVKQEGQTKMTVVAAVRTVTNVVVIIDVEVFERQRAGHHAVSFQLFL